MRGLAILAVSAVFGQHVVELVHALTVEHVRCAEHGELVDVAGSSATDRAASGLSQAPRDAQERHDHCAVEWLARFQAATPDPVVAPTLIETAVASIAPPRIAHSFTLLRYAPKTSPPSRAPI